MSAWTRSPPLIKNALWWNFPLLLVRGWLCEERRGSVVPKAFMQWCSQPQDQDGTMSMLSDENVPGTMVAAPVAHGLPTSIAAIVSKAFLPYQPRPNVRPHLTLGVIQGFLVHHANMLFGFFSWTNSFWRGKEYWMDLSCWIFLKTR